jgi:predicted CXXCH cytochrome family protein
MGRQISIGCPIIDKVSETENAFSFTIDIPEENKNQFQFTPGQYLSVYITDDQGDAHRRHYSITSQPSENKISFCVKRVPKGIVSNILCDEYSIGSKLQVEPPTGDFIVNEKILSNYKNLVFITGGSGITPIKSMISHALETNFDGTIFLIYANTDVSNIIFYKYFEHLKRDNCKFIFCIDNAADDWTGETGQLTVQKIEELFKKYEIPYIESCYFTCGPPIVVENVIQNLRKNKVSIQDVRIENYFVSAPTAELPTETLSIRVKSKGVTSTIPVSPNQTILDASLQSGLNIEHNCKLGNCLSCRAFLTNGDVHFSNSNGCDPGEILTCQAYPLDNSVHVEFGDNSLLKSIIHRDNLIKVGFVISCILLFVFTRPANESYVAKGPFNTGHEQLECIDCHKSAPGSTRQQLQFNAKIALSLDDNDYAHFGKMAVDNKECLNCHERSNDVHPTHRFMEPRFSSAREAIKPEKCTSCHNEHQGKRITIEQVDFCRHCHEDTEVKNDPLTISHDQLISNEEWNTCLQCHDFHGNHIFELNTELKDTIPEKEVREYFEGGKDPYSEVKKFIADME